MNHPLEQKLNVSWLASDWANVTVLVAVSGGADSMALLRATHAIRVPGSGRLVIVHFNHRLRGSESDTDELFVREQAARLKCICVVEHAPSLAETATHEDGARQLRYNFFRNTAKKLGARFVLTAHTADDQAETILHRILRGTGLVGLKGIPQSRQLLMGVSLVRPLLRVCRAEVLDYLDSIRQPYRQDSTNAESRFTRNRLRNELIPQLERDYNPRVKEALIRLGQLADEAQFMIDDARRDLWECAVQSTSQGGATINCDVFTHAHSYVVRQLLMEVWRNCGWRMRDMSWEHWRQLEDLAWPESSGLQPVTFPGGVRAVREGSLLRLIAGAGSATHDDDLDP